MRKLISLALAALSALSLCACASTDDSSETSSGNTFAPTEQSICENGASDYKIMLSAQSSARERYAAEELSLFFAKATGVKLITVSDGETAFSKNDRYFAIGNTAVRKICGSDFTYDELGEDGYKIINYGKSLVISGFGGDGTLFGVYDFLKLNLGIKFLADDEIVIPETKSAKLLDFKGYVSVPDFEERALGYLATQGNNKNALRMRLGEGVGNWGLWSHTHFYIINYDLSDGKTHKTDHPEWFSEDGTQLCLTNAEMRVKFISNLEKIIEDKPDAEYFMLGQEDQNTFCTCDECTASNAENGGESGTAMIFINSVAKEIKSYMNEKHAGRNVTLVTFAYLKTEEAPVNYDEKTETYTPVNSAVVAADNVGVMFAPIYACYSHSILDKNCNALSRNALLGWSAVAKKLLVWTYSSNYAAYLQPFNNWSSLAENFRAFKSSGVIYVYDQGIYNSYDSFHDLRVYVHSNLLWNSESNATALEKEFIDVYYGAAAPYISEYYELLKSHYMSLEQDGNENNDPFHTYCTWNLGVMTLTAKYWPKSLLNNFLTIFDNAYVAIDKIEDQTLKNKIMTRTLRESLYARYMMLELYSVYYGAAQIKQMIDSFESDAYSCNVTRYVSAGGIVGGPDLSKKITEWRQNLL